MKIYQFVVDGTIVNRTVCEVHEEDIEDIIASELGNIDEVRSEGLMSSDMECEYC